MLSVLTVCHRIVMTKAIRKEWKEHQSGFARGWRVSMEARKKVVPIDAPVDDALRAAAAATATTEKCQTAMLKDMHLIEAALAADRGVIALDETVRALFHTAAGSVGILKTVLWVNPGIAEEAAVAWLENKAKRDKHRMLGFRPSR